MQIDRMQGTIHSIESSHLLNNLPTSSSTNLTQAQSFESTLKAAESEGTGNTGDTGSTKEIGEPESDELRQAFQDFVGQTFFSQMIASMRTTQEGAAYFNGGRAEKIFQGQLDQMLSEELSDASASKISDPMFKLFQLRRQ